MKPLNNIRILHTVAALKTTSGGPSVIVSSLCEELGRLGASIEIATQGYASEDGNIVPPSDFVTMTYIPAINIPRFRLLYAPSFRNRCLKIKADLIHNHGLWLMPNHTAAVVARESGVPLIISTHGMLEPWALQYKAWKKQIAWRLYQHRDLLSATVLHATSVREAENLRQLGFRQPIALIPNGIHLPPWNEPVNSQTEIHTALFLGRIHPVKGLSELVRAWQIARPEGWRMVIAGPDEGGHKKEVEAAIHQAGLQELFQFVGAVEGEAKINLYRNADLFILPTFTENFGIVVAEALSCGVPVITTKGAPWEGLITHLCGWWIEIGAEPLADAIREAVALSDATRQEMGKRGRLFVEKNFGWTQIAENMLSVYLWVLGQGEKPACLITD
jgi:glycosyltransferase involved in cell wall biosynthesis